VPFLDIWNRQFKTLVKNVDPGILRARKRGKRAGVSVKHQVKNSRVPLPAIILNTEALGAEILLYTRQHSS